jgi:hypothetical protein
MKKIIHFLSVFAFMFVFASCNMEGGQNFDSAEENPELRAATLGFSDADAYRAHVAAQCTAGNHENCCCVNGRHLRQLPQHLRRYRRQTTGWYGKSTWQSSLIDGIAGH